MMRKMQNIEAQMKLMVDMMWELAYLLIAHIFLLKYEAGASEKHADGGGFRPLIGTMVFNNL